MARRIVVIAVLLAGSLARADGLDGAGHRDPTVTRGLFLPGGVVDPPGTVSFGVTTAAYPFAGELALHLPVRERVEAFAAAEWAAWPEVGWSAMSRAGVRAQVVRRPRLAVAVDLGAGPGRRFDDHDDAVQDVHGRSIGIAGGVGATACLDGARCDVVLDAHVLYLQELTSVDQDGHDLPRAHRAAAAASLVAGRRLRGVAAIGWADRFALYAGARFALPRVAFDLGVLWVPGTELPVPMLGLTLRSL